METGAFCRNRGAFPAVPTGTIARVEFEKVIENMAKRNTLSLPPPTF
jgi:hypothetical protein